jgi:ANTAR domain
LSALPTQTEGVAELEAQVAALVEENAQLRFALESRILIEQAKGVLMERLDLPAAVAFELLRSAARRSRTKLHALAAEVVATRVTPPALDHAIRELLRGYTNGSGAAAAGAGAGRSRRGHLS